MLNRYQVVTWSRDTGAGEKLEFTRKADAIRHARSFRGSEDYAAVYDATAKTAAVIFGNLYTPRFCRLRDRPPLVKIRLNTTHTTHPRNRGAHRLPGRRKTS